MLDWRKCKSLSNIEPKRTHNGYRQANPIKFLIFALNFVRFINPNKW